MTSAGDLSEDSMFLHDSIIRGHHTSKDIWIPYAFQPIDEIKAMPAHALNKQ